MNNGENEGRFHASVMERWETSACMFLSDKESKKWTYFF